MDGMRSKNARTMTAAERAHVERIKMLPCSVCDLEGPSDAHHINQGQHWTVVALCKECHGGPGYSIGWHGTKVVWRVKKMDELSALAKTIERLMCST
jgi:hypothetical protein